mmetsp:Transcript_28178/g.43846  ORF Transcript_28178/g.43846 Transcript_28178/m.43846 type:complete len:435 (-) Transcript_28178:194-1498(-)
MVGKTNTLYPTISGIRKEALEFSREQSSDATRCNDLKELRSLPQHDLRSRKRRYVRGKLPVVRNAQIVPLSRDKGGHKRGRNENSKGRENLGFTVGNAKKTRQNEKGKILIASIAKLLSIWWSRFESLSSENQRRRENEAANVIQRSLWRASMRKPCMDVAKFMSKVNARNGGWFLRLGIRIYRKRMATHQIKSFLCECGNMTHFARYISRYLADIRRVQRYVRGYLLCKRTRFLLLREIWSDVALTFTNNQDNRAIKSMQPIVSKVQISGTNLVTLKKLNTSISEWQDTNDCLAEILTINQGYNRKGRPKVKKPRQLSNTIRDTVLLGAMLSARRRYDQSMSLHFKNKKKKYLGSANRRLYPSFNVDDVIRILNIHEASVGVKCESAFFDDHNYRTSSSHPFLFWTFFANGCSVRARVLELYTEAYHASSDNS